MAQHRFIVIVLVTLIIGFTAGYVLRSAISPSQPTDKVAVAASLPSAPAEARGTQYFVAHVGEARDVVAGCRDGSVRGGECATAEEAIIKVDAAERRRKFLGK